MTRVKISVTMLTLLCQVCNFQNQYSSMVNDTQPHKKGKNLLPAWICSQANSFLLEKTIFSRVGGGGSGVQENKQKVTKVVSLIKYDGKAPSVHSPFKGILRERCICHF